MGNPPSAYKEISKKQQQQEKKLCDDEKKVFRVDNVQQQHKPSHRIAQ